MMRYLLDLPPTQQQSPRIVTSLVGNLYKPSFATLSGWGRFQDIQIYSILPSVHLFSTSTHHLLIVLVVSKSLSPDWLKKVPQMALFSRRKDVDFPFTWYPLEVQRLFFEWFFRKDYCFSRDLQSTIQGDYSFYGLWLPGWWKCVCVCVQGCLDCWYVYYIHHTYLCLWKTHTLSEACQKKSKKQKWHWNEDDQKISFSTTYAELCIGRHSQLHVLITSGQEFLSSKKGPPLFFSVNCDPYPPGKFSHIPYQATFESMIFPTSPFGGICFLVPWRAKTAITR